MAELVREIMIDASPETIWPFLTEPGKHVEWDGTVGLYNSGFQPQRAGLSPGVVLLAHVVRDAIERGRRRFDFLRGEERYKFEFGPTSEAVHAVTIGARP